MLRLLMMISFALPTVALPTVALAEQGGDKRERRICKRDVTTGSLIAARRLCLTEAEWKETLRLNRQIVDQWQNKIDGSRQSGGG